MRTIPVGEVEKIRLLGSVPLFAEVREDELRELAPAVFVQQYDDGETLFARGTRADGFVVVIEGEIEVYRDTEERRQVLHLLGAGEMCGEVPVFHGGHYPASARARGAAEVLYVRAQEFLEAATERPGILLEMLAVLSLRLRQFVGLIDDLSLKSVDARLAGYLLRLERDASGRCVLDCSKGELAERLGTIPETISRALGRMRREEIIQSQGSQILVLDADALSQRALGTK